jgi:hypothetical protein
MKNLGFKSAAIALLTTTALVPAANAQNADETVQSVYERYRPDYSAAGVRSGGFLFYPTIDLDGVLDSNIYKSDDNEEVDDFVTVIKPAMKLSSDWSRHMFELTAGAEIGLYADHGSEDYEDFNFGASTRLDMAEGSSFSLGANYVDEHEERGSPDEDGSQVEPTPYSEFTVNAGFKRDKGLISFAVDGSFVKSDYDDVDLIGSNDHLENDDRDRETVTGSVRLGYHMNDDYEAFVKFTTIAVKYDPAKREVGGPLRDSDGWDVVGGTAFDVGGKSVGEFYLGYVKRDWDSDQFKDVSAFKFGGSLLWSATGLTSVKFTADRNVAETTATADDGSGNRIAAAGLLSSRFGFELEHELRRNILLKATGSFNKLEFLDTIREDDMTQLGLGAKYMLNRTFSVSGDYKYDQRATNEADQDYKRHVFMLSLGAQW